VKHPESQARRSSWIANGYIWEPNAKLPRVCSFQGPFPLTPALSPRERAGVRGNGSGEYQIGASFAIASRLAGFRILPSVCNQTHTSCRSLSTAILIET